MEIIDLVMQNFKITISKLIATFLFLFITTLTFGQLSFNQISKEKKFLPNKIKTINQYKNDLLINIIEYDTLKNVIFSYYKEYIGENWKGENMIMITANLYNNDVLKKSFHLHSNTGLSILYYEYDCFKKNNRVFIRENKYDQNKDQINKNPFHFITDIKSFNTLISHPKIKQVEQKAQRYLLWEFEYDSIGNMLSETSFDENGDKSGYEQYKYDDNSNNTYSYKEWSEDCHFEYYYQYEKNYSLFENKKRIELKPSNLLQCVRVDYDSNEKSKKISDITFYSYDKNDRLIEQTKFNYGNFKEKYVYEYNRAGLIAKKITYSYNPNKIVSIEKYFYNLQGIIIKEKIKNYLSSEKTVSKFRYEYEYYK